MDIVEKVAINHYQNIRLQDTSPNNFTKSSSFSSFWEPIYQPKIIDEKYMSKLIIPITDDEIIQIIH
jgi:hypothetical protein